jgi:hypothetical protein
MPTMVPEYQQRLSDARLKVCKLLEGDKKINSGFGDVDVEEEAWRPSRRLLGVVFVFLLSSHAALAGIMEAMNIIDAHFRRERKEMLSLLT